jgi:PAS domain S-box-containing protein
MADWQGRLLDVNESSCTMYGYTREELLNLSLSDLDASTDKPQIETLEGLKQPAPTRFERAQRRKDGTTILVEMSVNYLPHAGGRIFCFARDITERKAAEDALVQLNEELEVRVSMRTEDLEEARKEAEDANRAKAAFLATMTHELRTPLNGVIGMLDVLRQTTLERHQIEMLDLITESGLSLLSIVDDILDFSKIEAGRLGLEILPFSPRDVVEKACSVIAPMAEKAEIELTMFADPKLPPLVLGDAVRLKQVLLNLVNNAVKFSSRQERPAQVSVRAVVAAQTPRHAEVEFEVKDNGIGMDAATQAELFKAFTQGDSSISRRFGGTGLGLTISRNLVELMGGEITVRSEPGEGSTFRVRISFPRPKEAKEKKAVPAEVPELAGLSCVVIGDPEGLHGDLATYLEAAGAAVDPVADLAEATQRSATHPTSLLVWILDLKDDAPSLETLRAAEAERPEGQTRFVLIGRGRRRKPRPPANGISEVDVNLLQREVFLDAVARAAGRPERENATTPIMIRRAPTAPPSRDEARDRRRLVLVAEDNEVNQMVILRQLNLLGYAADVAPGGREALEQWRTGDYSLLFADLHMPDMDGYQLTAAIRVQEGSEEHAVIIALTADVLKGGAQQCRDAGLDDYLCKPARLSEVKAMLEKWLPLDGQAPGPTIAGKPDGEAPLGPSVDIAVLEELVGRDPDVIRDFLRAFWISTAKTTSELKAACETKDAALIADLAHKLKSPARSVGALRLARSCEGMERAAKDSDFGAIEEQWPEFEAEAARVEAYLREA